MFRQFKKFHKTYYELHRHDAPSHQLARGIVSEIFGRIAAHDTDTIVNACAEMLTAECLKDLRKQVTGSSGVSATAPSFPVPVSPGH